MFRVLITALFCIWGAWAQSPQQQYLRCIQFGTNRTAPRLPQSAQLFSEFQIELNRLERDLDDCRDAACRNVTDSEVDATYFRFILNVLTDELGYEPATDLDFYVNQCSVNRPSSLLFIREQTPGWCFFAAVSDFWQREPEFETIRYIAVHNLRVTMNTINNCGNRRDCIDGQIDTLDNIYFQFFSEVLLSPNGNRLATRANDIVSKCIASHRTKVEDLLVSPIFCQQAAAANVSNRYPTLSAHTDILFQSFRRLLDDFWICSRNRTCIEDVEVKAEGSFLQYLDRIRSETYGTEALNLVNSLIANCRRDQGNQGGDQGQTPVQGNSTIECFRSAIEQISQHAPHLTRSNVLTSARANLEEIQNVWRRCNGPSAAVCQANANATANNIYFHTISNLFLEVQGIEVANLTDRAVNACNGRRPTRVTSMIESPIWCYLLTAANVSRDHPYLNFYIQDMVRGLQTSITNFANCEFHRPCKVTEVNSAGRLYEEFERRVQLHPDGNEVIRQSRTVHAECSRNIFRF